ncbi:hypothetical protein [Streptomyces sp. NBC_00557]|uniref:hypothetical protein n=1 Tax=Streptomyces sp. NBC_00557 TaxID=2975776 RepID=UPI002E8134C1|nr:hypothetical protein [Streptomyces sp. NBC_00557]WUC34861.1 hypothetical protein OG956_11860 [Streptomyces sp. NBC_00557]
MDLPNSRFARFATMILLGLAALAIAGCNPDPTDPENVDPIALVNSTSNPVRIFWCAGDGDNECAEEHSLGVIPAGSNRTVHISSYEVMLHVKTAAGPGGYVCEVDAPGSRIALSASYPSMKAAHDHCLDGASPSISPR